MAISVYTTTIENPIDPSGRQMDQELAGDLFPSVAAIVAHKKPDR